ncbi:MAG: DUF1501 domain-containing protein [Anaerolineae bacterium]
MVTTRRTFMKSVGLLGGGLMLRELVPSWMPRVAFAEDGVQGDVIVNIFLRGGADALNIIAPFGDDDYYRARPTLALSQPDSRRNNAVLELDDFFGLNPDMVALHDLLTQGRMTAIHAVGAPHASRSHFAAMDLIERGTDGDSGANTGWLGRYLMHTAAPDDSALRAIGWGDSLQTSLMGYIPATALQSILAYHLTADDTQIFQDAMTRMYTNDNLIDQTAQSTLATLDLVNRIDVDAYLPEHGASYYETNFGRALKQTAAIIKADAGLEVACIDMGGYDTHIAQGSILGTGIGSFPLLVQELADNVRAFHDDLLDYSDRVTVIIMSEFGRRVQENGAGGTDHGHGGMMMVVSPDLEAVTVHGEWPGMNTRFLDDGNLAITTDYRDVLSHVLLQRTSLTDTSTIFPEYTMTPLNLYRQTR